MKPDFEFHRVEDEVGTSVLVERESHYDEVIFDLFSKKQNRGSLLISIGYFIGRLQNEFRFDF